MHEISLIRNILEITQKNIPVGAEKEVREIHLNIGIAAGVVSDSLEFCFTALTQNTPLQNAQLVINHVPLILLCNSCHSESKREEVFSVCPECGSNDAQILSGMELDVTKIELTEQEESIS